MKRRKFTSAERREVYNKCGGHCAYCGCELEYKDMQIDHIVALAYGKGTDEFSNLLPACRSCNHRKGASSLESFRRQVERFPAVLLRDSATYRNAVRFNLVIPNPHKVVFYFEEVDE